MRSQETERAIATSAREVLQSHNASGLNRLTTDILHYLGTLDICPDELWLVIRMLIQSKEILSESGFNAFLRNLSVSKFHFSELQQSEIVELFKKSFPSIESDQNRMVVLSVILNFMPEDDAARILMDLAKESARIRRPVAELVWELKALEGNQNVSSDVRRRISEILAAILPPKLPT